MQCNGFLGSHFFLVNYDSPVNERNISGESLFPKGSHYLLVNNDRGSHYLLVKNDRGPFFPGSHFSRLQRYLQLDNIILRLRKYCPNIHDVMKSYGCKLQELL